MHRVIKNWLHWVKGWGWVLINGYPAKKLLVIGVTGTDGKTTTCNVIYEILRASGAKVGLVSTVYAKIGDKNQEKEMEMGLHVTNPGPEILQGLLKKFVDEGCTYAVVEVTSHGLDQNRVVGCNFQIAVLTNVSHEHLDYHKTRENYIKAKLKLFNKVKYAVLNKDDAVFEIFKKEAEKFGAQVIAYGKTTFTNIGGALEGEYNKYNIGAAATVAGILNIPDTVSKKVVKDFMGVPGRREEVSLGQDFRCVVDFAHTPNALENLLRSFKDEKLHKSKLIVVFGCTGERDKDKRPVMGEVAARLADVAIVTSDDVRGEDQNEIYKQIITGVGEKDIKKVLKENDRDKAIAMAVKMAKKDDVVVAAGMGHEKTQLVGKTEIQRSDREAFEKALSWKRR